MCSAEELFDVVDDHDAVIGQRPRSEVHRLGLKHRAVHVLIFNRRGELFLQKRSLTKDCFPGTWDSSASGHLAPGEAYDACAVREVREELGAELGQPPERLFRIAASPETGMEFVWVYRAEAEGPFRLHPDEISAGGWFAPEAINRWIAERPQDFAGSVPLIWRRLLEVGLFPADLLTSHETAKIALTRPSSFARSYGGPVGHTLPSDGRGPG